ncbi:LytR family transcriptional regulator [Nocardia sp. CT2-14]|uniref:LytR family transcriptional regulator n=2 Tax=Nocardia aurantiaca TaxID=2675850 RepID=A0A6I3KV23_9NOCA|nr:LytR family transcriptional regulator [Nocardia aurantiaca]
MYDDATQPLPVVGPQPGRTRRAPETPNPTPGRSRRTEADSARRRADKRRTAGKRDRGEGKPERTDAQRERDKRLRLAGRGIMALVATGVMGITGVVWYGETTLDQGFTRSGAISPEDVNLDGDINMLLIGLDTRKDLNGNDLPKEILDQLHAGDGTEGGYNANSLILVHIPKDLKHIVAFSIPRDDYVAVQGIPGYDHAKIKESYGLKKYTVEEKLKAKGMAEGPELERQGREAGRASIVQTVKALTGVPINRFAEISLAGFYDLATALGGVDVCLNHAVDDSYYSGAQFPAGPQHLDGSDALAFVRQRHGLENGDLDRTHRQQAFLTSVANAMKGSGTLANPVRLKALIDVAHKDVVLSDGWSLTDFASTLGRAESPTVEFRTLPVLRYDTVDGQDVNIIDPVAIKKTVREAFGVSTPAAPSAPATTPTSTLDVVNASGTPGQAAKVSKLLNAKGFPPGDVGNASYADGTTSTVYYGTGADTDAKQLSEMFGGLPVSPSTEVSSGHVKLVVGSDLEIPPTLDPTAATTSPTTTAGGTATTAAATDATTSDAPDSGKPVTTTIGSKIPCVN